MYGLFTQIIILHVYRQWAEVSVNALVCAGAHDAE